MRGIQCESCGQINTLRVLNSRGLDHGRKARTCECSACNANMVTIEVSKSELTARHRREVELEAYIRELKSEVSSLESEVQDWKGRAGSSVKLDAALNALARGARIVRRHGEAYELTPHEKRFLARTTDILEE